MSSVARYLYQEELYDIPAGVTVVLSKYWDNYSTEEKALLAKILGSIRIDLAAVQIITRSSFALPSMPAQPSSKVLIFGSETAGINPYEVVQAQGFTVIKADDLSELDDARKKSLWLALKQLAGI
jgi:hypothetical protein